MEDKRPKTPGGNLGRDVCVGCPRLGKRLRHEARGGWATPEDGGGSPLVGDELSLCVGGCFQTGAERSGADEPARSLDDAVRPKLCYAFDRYADAYLRAPT